MGKIKVGSVIGGRYEVLKVLGGKGKSGMGDVFVCLDRERNEKLVLKSFQEKFLSSKFIIDSFKHEALAWIILDNHPNIVRAKYVVKLDRKPYLALEYIPPDEKGRNSLDHFFNEKISLKQVLSWSIQICRAMEYAVSKGIISHLDIKPSNIMIDKESVLKLCDFGLARIFDQEDIKPKEGEIEDWKIIIEKYRPDFSYIGVFEGNVVTGSEKWMAPERFQRLGDIKSDIFSFGVVLYQIVNQGKLPFSEQSLRPFVLSTKNQSEIVIKELYPIVEKCLQWKPEDRYQNFSVVKIELEKLYEKHFGKITGLLPIKEDLKAFEFENKGISFLTLGLTDMAIRELWKAIEKRPNRAETHNYLGLAYKEKGAFDVALVSFNEALKINPNLYEVYCNLGDLYIKMNSVEKAIEFYEKALNYDKNYFDGQYKLAKALEIQNRLADAIQYYENLVKDLPKENRYYKKIRKKIKSLKKLI